MYWIALLPSRDEERIAWGWRALQFTPRVAEVDEAILLEVSGSERLWGGRGRLLRALVKECEPLARARWAAGETALVALALLRMKLRGDGPPEHLPQDLPLDALSAAREHVRTLDRTGCRTWGGLRALPRAGVARRFGAALLDALDAAYGDKPERYEWLQLPEAFDMKYELAALATTAPELMWSAQRLLSQLQVWLQGRHRGVLALELEWTLDLRRLNGVRLPSHEQLVIRTAQPTQDIAHLRRLMNEHLSRASLAAPANYLRLRSLETVPWGGINTSLLPEDNVKGERLHELVERLSVRLGEGNVVVPCVTEDHRPERMQGWVAARVAREQGTSLPPSGMQDAIYPPWLLPEPLALEVKRDVPHYFGPLRRLTRLYRIETGWWEDGEPALRDYFIARSEKAGLVWIYRERPLSRTLEHATSFRWYLQGLYA
ncbi:DNA polymerase Y family protein [Caenimonas aquaedulcis]|uniref:DNA polymerase Y family protein n=1 Tax=Caenimonas aquaedulcis TaxID=2793270 RepID=A0A931MFI8_9BURK|nr:DNA polymerase Y family protein [Caenimonas aquaedulcis]MBG9386525.1 DNA polymerase Y family protein [Caenimonas aquaedulcis]